jgi:hypothetical protein
MGQPPFMENSDSTGVGSMKIPRLPRLHRRAGKFIASAGNRCRRMLPSVPAVAPSRLGDTEGSKSLGWAEAPFV